MTPKQALFVLKYLGEAQLNATRAAVLAGYSPKTATAQGSRLLTNVEVQAAVAAAQARAVQETGITRERWLQEVGRIGFADIRKAVTWRSNVVAMVEDEEGVPRLAVTNEVALVDSGELDDDTAAALSEISQTTQGGLKIKLHDKIKALDLYGKAQGFVAGDGPNVNVTVGVFVDAPPPETRDEWLARKERERQERLRNVTNERTG